MADAVAAVGDRAILDVFPGAHLRLDGTVATWRHHQSRACGASCHRHAVEADEHRRRGDLRHRLRLSAVYGAAAVCAAREARSGVARSRRRPRRHAVPCVPRDHAAVVAAGHRGGRAAGVHSGVGRVRGAGTARRSQYPHDRQGAVERVLRQPRLAFDLRRHGDPVDTPGGADRRVSSAVARAKPGRHDAALRCSSPGSRSSICRS